MTMESLLTQLQTAQAELDPQFKALRGATAALKVAVRLASADKPDALPMNKALVKLETAASEVESEVLTTAVAAFRDVTNSALDDLAYDFAKDLRAEFEARGEQVDGRPPVLEVGMFTFNINIAARKGQWFYGKEALTKPIPLSLAGILKAYDRQVKRIVNRKLDDPAGFVTELQTAWQNCLDKRKTKPGGGRINLVEVFGQLTLNRQSARFWNAPSRSTFKDYERELFVRDLVLLRDMGAADDFKLGVASKSQADQATRSIWLPETAVVGQYYSDITFE